MSSDSGILTDYLTLEADLTAGPLATPTYASLNATLIGGNVSRGRFSIGADDAPGVGAATFLIDNTTAVLDPAVWYRGKHIRLSTDGGVRVFTGFIDRVRHDQSQAPWRTFAAIECVDRRTYHQRGTLAELGYTVPTNGRFIPPGLHVPWQPPDFGEPVPGTYDRAELLRQWIDAECGAVRILADGTEVLADRWWPLRSLQAAVDAGTYPYFSDDEAFPDAFRVLAREHGGTLQLSEPEEAYRDRIEFTGTSGVTQLTENVPTDYDPVALARSTQCPDDRWMKANTTLLLAPLKTTTPYWRRFTVRAAPGPLDVAEALALIEVGDLIVVAITPVGGTTVGSELFVESIEHTFSAESCTWDITFGCSSAGAWINTWGVFSDYLRYDDGMTYDGSKKYLP